MSGERGCAELLSDHFDMTLLNNEPLQGEGDVIKSGGCYYPTGDRNNISEAYIDAFEALDTDIVFISTVGQFAQNLQDIVQRYPTVLQLGQNLMEFAVTPNARQAIPSLIQIMGNVDAIVSPSEYADNMMETMGFRNSIHIPGPMDTSGFKKSTGESNNLVMLGRGEVIKNFWTPILAMPKIIKENINTGMAVLSIGSMVNTMKKMINILGLKDRIQFFGYRDDKKDILANSKVFIQPSISEMASRTLKEAMASGLPCVTSDIGGHRFSYAIEYATHDDPSEFANKIIKLLNDETLWKEKQEQILRDVKKFDIENVKGQYEKLFSQMMKLDKFSER